MNLHTRESLIAFEDRIRSLWEAGELPSLLHLCGGNEAQLIALFQKVNPEDWVFTNHRAHYHALLKGMPPHELEAEIRADRSMFLFSAEHRIYASAILAGTCGIAVGVARALKEQGKGHVWCFLGDGAVENGHFYESLLYATGHDLPITFVVEDNNRQVDTDIPTRRGASARRFILDSPNMCHYSYTPMYPHAGSGCKHLIKFERTTPLT